MNQLDSASPTVRSGNVIDLRHTPAVSVTTVAVIDSQPVFRRGVRSLLGEDSAVAVIAEATDVVAAQQQLGERAPDVILCDLSMLAGDGSLAASYLHSKYPTSHVVVLADKDDAAELGDAVKQGARGYLMRSCTGKELKETVTAAASGQSLLSPAVASTLITELAKMARRSEHPDQGIGALSRREREVLALVAEGLNNRAIASRLYISENTVKNHVRNIHEKLGVHNRMEAVVRAVREGLLKIA
ncbi:MAG: hypothetical protein RL745_818 [Actinomycetota bacterium]|jgi:two-component system NarL family response regulator